MRDIKTLKTRLDSKREIKGPQDCKNDSKSESETDTQRTSSKLPASALIGFAASSAASATRAGPLAVDSCLDCTCVGCDLKRRRSPDFVRARLTASLKSSRLLRWPRLCSSGGESASLLALVAVSVAESQRLMSARPYRPEMPRSEYTQDGHGGNRTNRAKETE